MKRLISMGIVLAAVAAGGCAGLSQVPGLGVVHEWVYASGEQALYYHRYNLRQPVDSNELVRVDAKNERGERLEGRNYFIRAGASQAGVLDEFQHETLMARRPSERPGCDEEWEYDFCIVYFRAGRVTDVVFKNTPDHPPVYHGSEYFMPK
jgi:hypothetical protein